MPAQLVRALLVTFVLTLAGCSNSKSGSAGTDPAPNGTSAQKSASKDHSDGSKWPKTLVVAPEVTAEVSGHVLLDGRPLPDAVIHFRPVNGKGAVTRCEVDSEGKYSASRISVGLMSVSISALRRPVDKTKTTPDDPTVLKTEEMLPSQYNTKSVLTAEVKPGKNQFDFQLTSR